MQARDLMTADPATCRPEDTVQQAARLMAQQDCGSIPVVADSQSRRLVAMVTDRDLACRCLAEGQGAETLVSQVMTKEPSKVSPDDHVDAVEQIMADRQVRRVPVVDERGRCVGIIAQADLARAAGRQGISERDVARVIEKVSEPSRGGRTETRAGLR